MAWLTNGHAASPAVHEQDVAVPMRDGVVLRADVLLPPGAGPFPVLVYRTPYGKRHALEEYSTFQRAVERGYAVVVQDVRGRYASAGQFAPYQNEGHDGYDTIEWAARQRWSNGKVGTFGLSYPGAVQWLAAVEGPPHLVAMVPAMTFSSHRNFFYSGGTFDLSWIEWIWDDIAPDVRIKQGLAGPRSPEDAERVWRSDGLKMELTLPLNAMSSLEGVAPYYYEWLQHPLEDPWWSWADLDGKYANTQAAVLNLSGWYDEHYGPEGAITNYQSLLAARPAPKDRRTALLIGPWIHGVQSTQTARAGDRAFAPGAAIDYDRTVLDWMDHYLKGVDNGVDRAPPIRYYVMGEETWRETNQWPPVSAPTAFFLAHARPGQAGTLTSRKPPSGVSTFVSDPANPVLDPYSGALGAHDYRQLGDRKDLLTFETPPLTRDTEVTGPIDAELYASCDCRDLDIWVRVYEVRADGSAWSLMSPGNEVQRASYRDGDNRRLLEPGQIVELHVKGPATSNLFRKGERIRVQLSGSFGPIFSRNLQTGESESVSGRTRPAQIHIHQDAQHPSRIMLPVVSR